MESMHNLTLYSIQISQSNSMNSGFENMIGKADTCCKGKGSFEDVFHMAMDSNEKGAPNQTLMRGVTDLVESITNLLNGLEKTMNQLFASSQGKQVSGSFEVGKEGKLDIPKSGGEIRLISIKISHVQPLQANFNSLRQHYFLMSLLKQDDELANKFQMDPEGVRSKVNSIIDKHLYSIKITFTEGKPKVEDCPHQELDNLANFVKETIRIEGNTTVLQDKLPSSQKSLELSDKLSDNLHRFPGAPFESEKKHGPIEANIKGGKPHIV